MCTRARSPGAPQHLALASLLECCAQSLLTPPCLHTRAGHLCHAEVQPMPDATLHAMLSDAIVRANLLMLAGKGRVGAMRAQIEQRPNNAVQADMPPCPASPEASPSDPLPPAAAAPAFAAPIPAPWRPSSAHADHPPPPSHPAPLPLFPTPTPLWAPLPCARPSCARAPLLPCSCPQLVRVAACTGLPCAHSYSVVRCLQRGACACFDRVGQPQLTIANKQRAWTAGRPTKYVHPQQ